MPELFVLQPTIHNRKNNSLRQPPRLRTDNRSKRQPSNSFREITEIYYVPDGNSNAPPSRRPPLQAEPLPTRRDSRLSPETPGLYHLPAAENVNRPPPAKKIYYKPLRYEPKRLVQPHKPLTPPIRKTVPPPPPVLRRPFQSPPLPATRASPRPPPAVRIMTPSPLPPMNGYQPMALDAPELYHLNNDRFTPEPIATKQPYRRPASPPSEVSHRTPPPPPPPPPPVTQSAKPVPPPILKHKPSPPGATELYHLDRPGTNYAPVHQEPIRAEQPHRSPLPQKRMATPPTSPPIKTFHSSPPSGPELYHLNRGEVHPEPVHEEPRYVESPYKPPPPPPASVKPTVPPPSARAPVPTPAPLVNVLPPPTRREPELFHLSSAVPAQPPPPVVPKHVEEPYRPSPPPVRVSAPPPPPPPIVPTQPLTPVAPKRIEEPYKPVPPPLSTKSFTPTPAPPVVVPPPPDPQGPELFHLTDAVHNETPIVAESYKPPVPPVNASPLPTRREPELFHMSSPVPAEPLTSLVPKHVEEPYRPSPPPARVSAPPPPPPPPIIVSTPTPAPPVITAPLPTSQGPELFHLRSKTPTEPPILAELVPTQQPSKPVPQPSPRISAPTSALPVDVSPALTRREPELYHLSNIVPAALPTPVEPKRVEEPYKPAPPPLPSAKPPVTHPPPPIQTISPTPLAFVTKPDTPPHHAPEFYHMVFDGTDKEPIHEDSKPQDRSHHSPLPSTREPPPPSIKEPSPPPLEKPELYYIKIDHETPPPVQPRQVLTSQVPSSTNRVSPTPSAAAPLSVPEMYYLRTPVQHVSPPPTVPLIIKPQEVPRQRTPTPPPVRAPPPRRRTPTPPRIRVASPLRINSPVARPMRTAAPLTVPTRKPVPVDDDVPSRRPSFSTNLQNVLTADRVVPLSESKASDSIKRSMNKFRFNDD